MSKPRDKDWQSVSAQIEELRAVLPSLADLPEVSVDNAAETLSRIASTTEHLRRQVIRDRILRDSLQEIIGALLRGRDPDSTLETLTDYLAQVLGVKEVLLVRRTVADQLTAYYSGSAARDPEAKIRHLDSYPWEEGDLSEATLSPRQARSFATLPAHLRPDDYAFVIPLETDVNPAEQEDTLLGYLCYNVIAKTEGDSPSEDAPEAGFGAGEISRRIVGMLATLRHREEMERADAFRRQLLGAMQDGVVAFDEQGMILEMNAASTRLLGGEPEDLRGGHIDDLPSGARALTRILKRAIEQKAASGSREVVVHRGNDRRPIHVAMSELRDGGDNFHGVVANLTDLTPIRQMEEEIDRLDRLAALGRFAAGIAHEIRNPLAGIGAGVEYLSRRFESGDSEQTDIRYILGEVARLNSIVSDLLDYTHPRPLNLQWTDTQALADRIRSGLAPLAEEKNVRLDFLGPPLSQVYCDAGRMEQVLLNLVRNAIEASPQPGVVTMTWSEDECFHFTVEDEGAGLSDEQCRRAFEPFFTTKGTGTGLGLYLSHSIVEQHEGHLRLGNCPTGGASIEVELPCREAERTRENAVVHLDH